MSAGIFADVAGERAKTANNHVFRSDILIPSEWKQAT